MSTPRRYPKARPVPAPRVPLDEAGLDWRARGACVDLDPELFFPDPSEAPTEAQAACAGCPVRLTCLSWALSAGAVHGVWGGTTEDERRVLLARRSRGLFGRSARADLADDDAGPAGAQHETTSEAPAGPAAHDFGGEAA